MEPFEDRQMATNKQLHNISNVKRGKYIEDKKVTRSPQQAVEAQTSRLPHFLDNRFRDGDEVVSLTRPKVDSWYSFLLDVWIDPRAHNAAGMIMSIEKKPNVRPVTESTI
jgi:hypothetical protein